MSRKPKYSTPEEAQKAKIEGIAAWQAKNTSTINVRVQKAEKARLEAYARYKGVGNATMLRDCAERCMVLDGWEWVDEKAKVKDEKLSTGAVDKVVDK